MKGDKMRRRTWLKGTGLGVVAVSVGCGDDDNNPMMDAGGMDAPAMDAGMDAPPMDAPPPMDAGPDLGPYPVPPIPTGFGFGVASGDPLPNAVILWSRYVPDDGATSVDVDWIVATDAALTDVVRMGTLTTDADRDWTLKVDADGLDPATTYYYAFRQGDASSMTGRTRTAPQGDATRLRFGVVSCSSYGHGFFHVYRELAGHADLDAILHLGDYIYEYASESYGRERLYDPPHEILNLDDYRRRYQLYRIDPDCQALHQQHPMVCVWDDHESANNAWRDGAENHEAGEGSWADRKAAAYQAYAEWMPIREQEEGKIWRSLDFGNLLQLTMLDTRLWGRDEQDRAMRHDPSRTLLGMDQETWFAERMMSGARWQLIGQQVMLGHWEAQADGGGYTLLNDDQWDGYTAARSRFFDTLETTDNAVVLTGDIHSHWAMDLTRDPHDGYDPATGDGSIGVEFVVSAVTSPGFGTGAPLVEPVFRADNPHMQYTNLGFRGYLLLDVTADAIQGDFFILDAVTAAGGMMEHDGSLRVRHGMRRLEVQDNAMPPADGAPELAPGIPGRDHLLHPDAERCRPREPGAERPSRRRLSVPHDAPCCKLGKRYASYIGRTQAHHIQPSKSAVRIPEMSLHSTRCSPTFASRGRRPGCVWH